MLRRSSGASGSWRCCGSGWGRRWEGGGRGGGGVGGGEAGIGKATLAEVARAEGGERGAAVLVGRCYDLSETPPYGPWRELFGRAPRDGALPVLPAATLPPEAGGEVLASQEAIFARVGGYLGALSARQPVVVQIGRASCRERGWRWECG